MANPLRPAQSEGKAARALTSAEQRMVLREWNDTARDVPQATLAELFEAQVARTPDAVALTCGDVALSYADLNQRADRLAGYLVYFALGAALLTFLITRNVRSTISVVIVAGSCGIAAGIRARARAGASPGGGSAFRARQGNELLGRIVEREYTPAGRHALSGIVASGGTGGWHPALCSP